MEIFKLDQMKDGWFVGDFEPSAFRTGLFETCFKKHQKGEKWPTHYHRISTEINLLVKGSMKMQNKLINEGDIFVIYPYEVANPEFLEDCEVFIIKTPSIPGDKYEMQ